MLTIDMSFDGTMETAHIFGCNYKTLTLKEPGFLDPSHSQGGGGGFRPPQYLGNRMTKIDETR